MAFTTYEDTINPHVTTHKDVCPRIRQHGGTHKHKEGQYRTQTSYKEAHSYATATKLPVRNCFYCKPV